MDDEVIFPKHVWDKDSKELHNAIYDDWKRKAIDNAKKRAVAQNVDYPTFANLVSVAHLKPIQPKLPEQGDGEELQYIHNGTAPAWSFDSTGINNSLELNEEREENLNNMIDFQKLQKNTCTTPAKITNDVFRKNWRYFNRNVLLQMAYLTSLDPSNFLDIFKVELPPNILIDILGTICTCLRAEKNEQEEIERLKQLRKVCGRDIDENWTMRILEVLTKCGRFTLSLGFVGEKTCAMVQELLDQLVQSNWRKNHDGENEDRIHQTRLSKIQNLGRLYKVNIDTNKVQMK